MPSTRMPHSSIRPGVASLLGTLAVAAVLAAATPTRADDLDWPRQFDSPSGSFVVYQPQPENLEGDVLTGRAAFSLWKDGAPGRTFGVLWYTERIEIDRDSSTVTARSLDVTKVRLPGITPDEASRYESLVETQAAQWDLSISVEELQAGLAAAEKDRASVAGLDNTPPRIIFRDRRAVLVVYDGAPVLVPIDESLLERVANTPYAVVYDPIDRDYYLNGANLWYRAKNPLGPWTDISSPPAAIREVVPPDTSASDQVEGPPPDVLTATEPTELIATDGPPRYAPLVGDELLYVANTESDVVLEVSTQELYVLLSGRWFRAPSTDGPWTFVRGDELPASFRDVPPDSPKGNILASVAGTDQAEDAIADAEIPQTSAIQRGDHGLEVTYAGEPHFAPIAGSYLEYATNTDAEVLLADGRFYACDQGVWYASDSPYGPWIVSDTRPLGIEDIPPGCPVYDVRYVYIYDSTPEVVYMGYLPGYLGWYPYYGTVVYGTGYRYSPWRSRHEYYPRRFTWGFQAHYNPWLSRWSFGYTYASGFLRVGTRWQAGAPVAQRTVRSAWFGPGGYRRPLVAQDMTLLRTRRAGSTRPRPPDGLPANIYNRPENIARVDRTVKPVPVRSIASPISRPAVAPDNVFAGKDGNVYRRDPSGTWEMRKGTTWKRTELPSPPPASPPPPAPSEKREPMVVAPTSTGSTPPEARPERRQTFVQPPAPQRENPREKPAPPPVGSKPREDQPTPPPVKSEPPEERPSTPPERPTQPEERPTQQREQPTPPPEQQTPPKDQPGPPPERPSQREERPAPPPVEQPAQPDRPSPGDLEREFHARQRSDREDDQDARKAPQDEQRNPKAAEPQRNKSEGRSAENAKPEKNR